MLTTVCDYRLLGPVSVRTAKGMVSPGGPIASTLLAALLLNPGKAVSFRVLTELLWDSPEVPPSRLYAPVSRLRTLLRDANGDELVRKGRGYLLTRTTTETDLETFLRRAATAREQRGQEAVRGFRDALSLWVGQPLMGVTSPLADRERPRLTELRLAVQEDLFDAELAVGRYQDVTAEAPALLAENFGRERLHEQLMRALDAAGRGAEALEVYSRFRQTLADASGTDPSPRLQALQAAILRNECSPTAGEKPREEVRTIPATVPPAELPPGRPDFTGRASELTRLDGMLQANAPALGVAVVAGMPGVGKTALAVHWGHRVTARFPDGQLYLNLRGHDRQEAVRPIDALATLLRSLGLPPERVPPAEDAAAALYRSMLAARRVLVLLDDARCAEQVRPLLPGAAGCFVVVTSRDQLADLVTDLGARRVDLDCLPADDAVALITRTIGTRRTEAEEDAVHALAAACGNLPLGIVIAAANLAGRPALPVADYVRTVRTDTVARLKVHQGRTAVRVVFDEAYRGLPTTFQRFFRVLGLLPGSDFGVTAAAVLADVSDEVARELLHGLNSANLTETRKGGRFALHDLLRAYARELAIRIDADSQAATARLYDWYLHTADEAARLLYPEKLRLSLPHSGEPPPRVLLPDRQGARSWLDQELPSLLAVIRRAALHGPPAITWLLSDVLRGYFWLASLTTEWLEAAEIALRTARSHGSQLGKSAALLSIGTARSYVGDYSGSVNAYVEALRTMERAGWRDGESAAIGNLGFSLMLSGRPAEAVGHLVRAAQLAGRTGRRIGVATNLLNLGYAYQRLGRLPESEQAHEQALAIYQAARSATGMASAAHGLGIVFTMVGRLDKAADLLHYARSVYAELGDQYRDADALVHLARLHRDAGNAGPAEEAALRAWRLTGETGQLRQQVHALNVRGVIRYESGRLQEAAADHAEALSVALQLGHGGHEAEARIGLARSSGESDSALRHLEAALKTTQALGYRILHADALLARAENALRRGDRQAFLEDARRARDLHRSIGYRAGEARVLSALGSVSCC